MENKKKEYICVSCEKSFGNHKHHYQAHINKKFPCKPPKLFKLKFDKNTKSYLFNYIFIFV